MKPEMTHLITPFGASRATGLLAGCLLLAAATRPAVGAESFTVDSSQSYISLSGEVLGLTLQEQGSGSLTTHFQGTVVAAIGTDSIQFPGQSQVVAMDSGSWQPRADASDGSEPANYGAEASGFFSTGVAALRGFEMDITSGAVAFVNGQFDPQSLTFSGPDGASSSLAYRVDGALQSSGVLSLAGRSLTGQSTLATVTTTGNLQVLTIPVHYQLYFSLTSQNDTTVTLTGQLVATRSLSGS